jgi:nitrile hydratase accessory protein
LSPADSAEIAPRRKGGEAPVFAEAWHAEVLAVAHGLTLAGLFSAAAWSSALGAALSERTAAGESDSDETYYAAALAALERLVAERSPETGAAHPERIAAWRRAYLRTPHGQPVELAAGIDPDSARSERG